MGSEMCIRDRENMDSMRLYDLEEAFQHLFDGLDAVEIMVMGLE